MGRLLEGLLINFVVPISPSITDSQCIVGTLEAATVLGSFDDEECVIRSGDVGE